MSKSEYLTKAQIVEALYEELTQEDTEALRANYKVENDLYILHHGYGTYIRNTFKLWERENPLVTEWFNDCDQMQATGVDHQYMDKGIDCHPLHPDAVSFEIIKEVWYKVVTV